MKKTDIMMIVLIASISIVIAFFVTRAIFGGAPNETQRVKTVEKIDASVVEPSPQIFNSGAINPAYRVDIKTGSQ